MKIWMVAREYAGIAEAGGVKNVTCSLSESLVAAGQNVTLFIPLYGCTNLSAVKDFTCVWHKPVTIDMCEKNIIVTFSHGHLNGVEIVFIGNMAFTQKKAVYTYTKEEEEENPSHKKGEGHLDSQFLNTLFQKAVIAYSRTCDMSEKPDIINCHDATAAMVPVFMHFDSMKNAQTASFFCGTKCVVTIHNAGCGYRHEYKNLKSALYYTMLPKSCLAQNRNKGKVEPFVLASQYACMATVSPQYAKEILADRKGDTDGLSRIYASLKVNIEGITNGIDCRRYDPEKPEVSLLPYAFNPIKRDLDGKYKCRKYFLTDKASEQSLRNQSDSEVVQYGYLKQDDDPNTVYIAYHGRVVAQKGIPVLKEAAEKLMRQKLPVKFIFMGHGDPVIEKELVELAEKYAGQCVYFNGYGRSLARLCIAVADFAVCPSHFEPCGTEDFIAQIFGTIPIAHATGGLKKIIDEETGFLYEKNDAQTLCDLMYSLIKIVSCAGKDIFSSMIAFAAKYVKENYSWDKVTQDKYIKLFEKLLEAK